MNYTEELIQELIKAKSDPGPKTSGQVISVGDGVAKCSGLSDIGYLELVEFENGTAGVALNLEKTHVAVLILGKTDTIKVGDSVVATKKLLSVPVGEELLGRIINPLSEPLDNGAKISVKKTYPVEKIAPGVIAREPVTVPLATGIKAIDALVPIGRGQRELIIGDRGIGKTSLVIDTIMNQKDTGVICIYCAIGQKASRIAQIAQQLEIADVLQNTIIVSASSADPAALQYLAPYAATAIGEYFMDQGKDVLVVYDDLTKHAWAYRELSLILKRPSGREAYPGDIFYLHARLLERACRLNQDNGGGSLTALPIIETQAGDISAYIPTNVISITDGQIFLEPELFYQGVRPAISVGLSVSRVGGTAQLPALKQVAGPLRLELAQYRELAGFAQFASDLDDATKKQIEQGKLLTEVLKQKNGHPISTTTQVICIWAATNGLFSDVPLDRVQVAVEQLEEFCKDEAKSIADHINSKAKLTDEVKNEMKKIVTKFFNQIWQM